MTCSMSFATRSVREDSPFLHLIFFHSICVLCVSILSKWTSRYLRLSVRSMTSSSKETAGIVDRSALLLRLHQRS